MNKLQKLAAEREAKFKTFNELAGLADPTEEQTTEAEGLMAEIKTMDVEITRLKGVQDAQLALAAAAVEVDVAARPDAIAGAIAGAAAKAIVVPVEFRHSQAKNLRSISGSLEEAQRKAYAWGQYLLATLGGNANSAKWCNEHGLPIIKAAGGNVNEAGGFLVPVMLDSDLIDLREKYGICRQTFKNRKMTTDTLDVPRRTGGLVAYFSTDNVGKADSTKQWDQVQLIAKKIITLALYSTELSEDAIIDIGDDLSNEIGWVFAQKEDQCGLLGDATSPYGGITGVINKLLGLSGTIANIAGLVVGTGTGYATSWDSFVLADYTKVIGKLPQYADTPNTCWLMHKTFYEASPQRLKGAGGGNRYDDIRSGDRGNPMFLGYPVKFAQVMPSTPAITQIPALLGDFTKGASFGDRRQTTIATSTDYQFGSDQLAVRGTERFDIVIHDVGNASATAANRVPGPIVGLITAGS